ncbi:MAG: dihydrofolate reductase [Betaproteobacteria bacterium]|nr:dihydrofolate reductase [Betaproteobacteria bacterium]
MSLAPPPPKPGITLIAAVARNNVIGLDNAMPWRLPEDLKRFKALTLGHPVIMGRKTWESLGRPLPGRTNIVISRNPAFTASGATPTGSLEAALAQAAATGTDETFIIGGAEIYRQALPLADRLQLTMIEQEFAGDAFFPSWDAAEWHETQREQHRAEAGFDYAFVTYARL